MSRRVIFLLLILQLASLNSRFFSQFHVSAAGTAQQAGQPAGATGQDASTIKAEADKAFD